MKSLKKQTILNDLIPRSAGYQTDQHEPLMMSTKANPLPDDATQIRFRRLNKDFSFTWTEWYYIKP